MTASAVAQRMAVMARHPLAGLTCSIDIEDFFNHLSDIGCFKGAELSAVWDDLLDHQDLLIK